MQCKDIPDAPIIEFIWQCNDRNKWANWALDNDNDVCTVMSELPTAKLALAKMRQLIRRGLVQGCGCGCRGDFVVTDAGCQFIGKERHKRFIGNEPI